MMKLVNILIRLALCAGSCVLTDAFAPPASCSSIITSSDLHQSLSTNDNVANTIVVSTCDAGFELPNGEKQQISICVFQADSMTPLSVWTPPLVACTDINECNRNLCPADSTCENTEGSYKCICNEGYVLDGQVCKDIDECVLTMACHYDATCQNNDGSYTCTCNTGYYHNGPACKDKNECESKCSGDGTICTNTPGSYNCQCKPGFLLYSGEECIDIDECRQGKCPKNSVCTNSPGSFMCRCHTGYGGPSCEDINECLDESLNTCKLIDLLGSCENVAGTYYCCPGNGFECTETSGTGRDGLAISLVLQLCFVISMNIIV